MNKKRNLEEFTGFKSLDSEDFCKSNKQNYDLIVILNNHPSYKNLSSKEFVNAQINKGAKVIDSWDIMELTGQKTISNLFISDQNV